MLALGAPGLSHLIAERGPAASRFQWRISGVSAPEGIPVTMKNTMKVSTKRNLAAATAVGAAMVAATALAVPAHAETFTETFTNASNPGLCLDADAHNGGVGPGANVTAWTCNGGRNQTWVSTVVG
jgi:ricin-type beta-trefoil lectin protein